MARQHSNHETDCGRKHVNAKLFLTSAMTPVITRSIELTTEGLNHR